MSAQIKLSDKACFVCRSKDQTLWMKLKDGTFQGVVCVRHLFALLDGREAVEQPQKSNAQPTEK